MLDRQIQVHMKDSSPEERQAHFERCVKPVEKYMYGKRNGPSREFMFDAMSFRAWVYALSKILHPEDGIDVVRSLYIGTVSSPKKQKQKMVHLGKIAAEEIDRREGTFGLRTDVSTCLNFETDLRYKGLRRRLLKKNFPDIDAKVIMNQFFSPFPDYVFHLVEVPDPELYEYVTVRVVNSKVVRDDLPEWAVSTAYHIVRGFDAADIMPHHPQYVEHENTGQNFVLRLVQVEDRVLVYDMGATINKEWVE